MTSRTLENCCSSIQTSCEVSETHLTKFLLQSTRLLINVIGTLRQPVFYRGNSKRIGFVVKIY